ncbi:UNVERIFIED_CONTAM: hypothetical protein Sindi_2134200 [Sesamum indicum]
MHARLDQINETQYGLQAVVMNMEHTMVSIQQQLQSVVEQLEHYNRNKSILGDGLTPTLEKGSSSRVTAQHSTGAEDPTSTNSASYDAIHRMEFPLFNGEEARIWIRTCLRYFQMIPIPEDQKVHLVAIHMQEFNMLDQETTVNAYLEKFEKLEAHMLIFNKNVVETFLMMKLYKCIEAADKGCRIRHVYVLMSEEEAKAYEEGEEQLEGPTEEGGGDVTVSFHAMCGSINSSTQRVNGRVNGKEIHILIDSGSTHCFVVEKVAQVLGCKLEPTTPMMVRIADGGRVLSKLFCPTFCWEIQGHEFSHPVRVLKLGGYDCILGCEWLSGNNPIELDFHQLQVTITQAGKKVILKASAERADLRTLSVYSLNRLLRKGSCGVKGELYATKKAASQSERDPRLLELIHQFKDIFQEPKTELLPDAIPKKQHPYRYTFKRLKLKIW